MSIKPKQYQDLAKEVPVCMGCKELNDGTVVCAHRNRLGWGLDFGRGKKTICLCSAFLCHPCHVYGDGEGRKDYDWWELAVHRSLTWAWKNGHI